MASTCAQSAQRAGDRRGSVKLQHEAALNSRAAAVRMEQGLATQHCAFVLVDTVGSNLPHPSSACITVVTSGGLIEMPTLSLMCKVHIDIMQYITHRQHQHTHYQTRAKCHRVRAYD